MLADSLITLAIGINDVVGSAIWTAVDETKKVVAIMDLKIKGLIWDLSLTKRTNKREIFVSTWFDLVPWNINADKTRAEIQKNVKECEIAQHLLPWIEKRWRNRIRNARNNWGPNACAWQLPSCLQTSGWKSHYDHVLVIATSATSMESPMGPNLPQPATNNPTQRAE